MSAALKAVFEQRGLGAVCGDVCRELGVGCVDDLADVDKEMLEDLPKYIKDQLRPLQKKRLLSMFGSQPVAATPATTELRGLQPSAEAAVGPHAGLARDGDASRRQVFLGYRVASDADLVESLYYRLKAEGVKVWWDKRCLPDGQPWEQGFADGLCGSEIFVPVLSKAALAPCARLTGASACDNVVLEHQLALELQHRGHLRAIFPVLVGEPWQDSELGDIYGDFFKGGGMPACHGDVAVQAVEGKLVEHLERLGKGAPLLPASARTIKATLAAITSNQGVKLLGVRSDTVDNAVAAIVKLASK